MNSWMQRFSRLTFIFIFSLCSTQVLALSAQEFSKVINVSGRQRMLTQRMTRAYLAVALGNQQAKSLQDVSVSDYTKALNAMTRGDAAANIPVPPDDAIKTQLSKLQTEWTSFQLLLAADANKTNLKKIYKANLKLLKSSNKLVQLYVSYAKLKGLPVAGQVVNIAGRQRMLSQRITKAAYFYMLGVVPNRSKKETENSMKTFELSFKDLVNGASKMDWAGTKNPATKAQMQKVDANWQKFKALVNTAVADPAKGKTEVANIEQLSNAVLKEMHKAVGMYEKDALAG